MQNLELRNEYKGLYAVESARREELNHGVDRPIAIISAMAGVVYFALAGLAPPATLAQCALVLVGIGVIALMLAAIWYLVCSYYGHAYGFLPTTRHLEEYRSNLIQHHIQTAGQNPAEIEKHVLDHVYTAFVDGAHRAGPGNLHRTISGVSA